MSWHATALAADAADDAAAVPLRLGGNAVVLVAWRGRWYAIEDRCSHAGCAFSVDGEFDGFHAICDCHGSEFDVRTGRPLRPPATEPIATYRVRMAAGLVEVDL